MQRSTVRLWISVFLLLSLVFLPSAVLAQDDPPAKDEVAEEVADEADLSEEEAAALDEASEAEREVEDEAEEEVADEADMSEEEAAALDEASEAEQAVEESAEEQLEGGEGEPEPGEGEMVDGEGEIEEAMPEEGGAAEGSEGETPEYLPVTGGEHNATYMVVLAILALLFTGAYATRRI